MFILPQIVADEFCIDLQLRADHILHKIDFILFYNILNLKVDDPICSYDVFNSTWRPVISICSYDVFNSTWRPVGGPVGGAPGSSEV